MLIVGGSSTSTCAVADIYKLSTVTWRMEKVLLSSKTMFKLINPVVKDI